MGFTWRSLLFFLSSLPWPHTPPLQVRACTSTRPGCSTVLLAAGSATAPPHPCRSSALPGSRHRSTRLYTSFAPPAAGPALLQVGLGAPSHLRVTTGHLFSPMFDGENKVNNLLNILIFGCSSDSLVDCDTLTSLILEIIISLISCLTI